MRKPNWAPAVDAWRRAVGCPVQGCRGSHLLWPSRRASRGLLLPPRLPGHFRAPLTLEPTRP